MNQDEATGGFDLTHSRILQVPFKLQGQVAVCIKAKARCTRLPTPTISPADPRFYSSRQDEKYESIEQAWRLWNKAHSTLPAGGTNK